MTCRGSGLAIRSGVTGSMKHTFAGIAIVIFIVLAVAAGG
jgi:nitrate reductase NapE component